MANAILRRTVEIVRDRLGPALDDVTVDRMAIGLFFTGVKRSTGHAGACATPVKEVPDAVCCTSSAMAMPFPGKLRGRRAAGLLDEALEQVGIRRAVGATLNALAQMAIDNSAVAASFEIVEGLDAFAAAGVGAEETVVVLPDAGGHEAPATDRHPTEPRAAVSRFKVSLDGSPAYIRDWPAPDRAAVPG
jgi:Domain of unknown function (DUF364).